MRKYNIIRHNKISVYIQGEDYVTFRFLIYIVIQYICIAVYHSISIKATKKRKVKREVVKKEVKLMKDCVMGYINCCRMTVISVAEKVKGIVKGHADTMRFDLIWGSFISLRSCTFFCFLP